MKAVQPIHSASGVGHLEIIKYLVGKGVSVLAKNDGGWQTIHYAIRGAFRDSEVSYQYGKSQ